MADKFVLLIGAAGVSAGVGLLFYLNRGSSSTTGIASVQVSLQSLSNPSRTGQVIATMAVVVINRDGTTTYTGNGTILSPAGTSIGTFSISNGSGTFELNGQNGTSTSVSVRVAGVVSNTYPFTY
jgi:hypothetical protein